MLKNMNVKMLKKWNVTDVQSILKNTYRNINKYVKEWRKVKRSIPNIPDRSNVKTYVSIEKNAV